MTCEVALFSINKHLSGLAFCLLSTNFILEILVALNRLVVTHFLGKNNGGDATSFFNTSMLRKCVWAAMGTLASLFFLFLFTKVELVYSLVDYDYHIVPNLDETYKNWWLARLARTVMSLLIPLGFLTMISLYVAIGLVMKRQVSWCFNFVCLKHKILFQNEFFKAKTYNLY